jgi:hypothetical protein
MLKVTGKMDEIIMLMKLLCKLHRFFSLSVLTSLVDFFQQSNKLMENFSIRRCLDPSSIVAMLLEDEAKLRIFRNKYRSLYNFMMNFSILL